MELSDCFKKKVLSDAKSRYKQKLAKCGLARDPYCIPDIDWDDDPQDIPEILQCSLSTHMTATLSTYTEAARKVSISYSTYTLGIKKK